MRKIGAFALAAVLAAGCAGQAAAQGTTIDLGAAPRDRSAPLEITADQLAMNQSEGTARFAGNVLASQGTLRLSAVSVLVAYATGSEGRPGQIVEITAEGDVLLVNGPETARADRAVYTVESGIMRMSGNVLLTQGGSAISGERLQMNLDDGTGVMEGRVKTIFQADPAQ